MSTLPADLEALMPEPVAKVLSWTCGSYHRNYKLDWTGDAKEGATLYTADQMREAILAATERAAKIVLHHDTYGDPIFGWQEMFVAAIRGAK